MDRNPLGPGVILVDKPAGISSARVVDVVRRVTGIRRTGHGGTLDPFATGLLPVLVGRENTREADALLAGDKEYVLTIRFGSETDTCDLTGTVVARGEAPLPSDLAIREAMAPFVGEIEQEAPAYSALKHQGKPLYWYARRGETVIKPPRIVAIRSIDLVEWLPPDAVVRVACGKGAYMRSLARDLGRVLGCLAHLVALRRTAVGPYRVDQATPLWRLERRATAPRQPATRLDLPRPGTQAEATRADPTPRSVVASPDVAGHTTGGAIDITIRYRGRELDMGTKIADFNDPELIKTNSARITSRQADNRKLLHDLLVRQGLAPFYGEWWHFSYGDREWACFYKKKKALYSEVSYSE